MNTDIYREHIELKITHKSAIRRYESEISSLKQKIKQLEEKIKNPFIPKIHDASLEELLIIVANVTNQLPEDILGKVRLREYVIARHLLWYIAKTHLNYTLVKLAEYSSHRHHSSIMHGIKQISDAIDMNFNPEKNLYIDIMNQLEANTKLYNRPAKGQTADTRTIQGA